MAKNVYTKGVTPIGEAYFAHLVAPENYMGASTNKFTVLLKLAPQDTKDLLKKIDAEWSKYAESEEGRKHKYKYDYVNGLKEYNGEEFFKFKMTHVINTSRGPWERTVPIFDSACKAMHEENEIGNGSKIKVAYELVPFYITDKNYGVTLRLTGVQVLSLEHGGHDADSFGFHEEEGFKQEDEDMLPLAEMPESGGDF